MGYSVDYHLLSGFLVNSEEPINPCAICGEVCEANVSHMVLRTTEGYIVVHLKCFAEKMPVANVISHLKI
jgi:hypothetical protein